MLFRFEKRSEVVSIADAKWTEVFRVNGLSSEKAKEATYFTCLRILSDTVSKLPLKLFSETDNGTTKANTHYLYNMLKLRPNPLMSSSTFWKVVEFQRNEWGYSLVYIDTVKSGKNAGKIQGLYPLDMSKVTKIWVDDVGLFGKKNAIWYVYNTEEGKETKIKHDKVLHFFGLTADGTTGMPIKEYLKTIVDNAKSSQDYMNNYFKNGLFAKGLMQYTGDIAPEKQELMRQRFEGMANGLKNAGRILPVPLGFSFQTINSTMADAQFLELNQLTIQQIAAAFGIKMHQINNLDRATHSNVEHMQKEFYIDTLQAILTMYEQELSFKLLTSSEIESGHFLKFNVDSILRSSLKERYDAYGIAIDKGFLTPNEVRELEDRPKLEGANELICNGNMQKLTEVGAYYKNKPPVEGGDK
ncbi:phage portal protein [Fictibacillus nanhaiensis]|uniref:phage portal protein n=1 Tax=Fictibacillus nanhaiensis TaxID=742169 RepID=UPI00203DE733|nr:phage portal protein [Fictibacillus nanhaiensis]MCM3730063.1 phage portal protein [Fictibacillus nanhaiensis]